MSEKRKKILIQFIKFGLIGLLNTFLNYVIYSFCYYALHIGVYLANFIGFVITVFIAFLLQSKFVFKQEGTEKRIWWKVLIKTYISYSLTGLFLTEILLWFWLQVLHIEQYLGNVCLWLSQYNIFLVPQNLAVSIAPLLNIFITVPTNFLVNKFWAYKNK